MPLDAFPNEKDVSVTERQSSREDVKKAATSVDTTDLERVLKLQTKDQTKLFITR